MDRCKNMESIKNVDVKDKKVIEAKKEITKIVFAHKGIECANKIICNTFAVEYIQISIFLIYCGI